jgi:hypothetical protein
MRALLLTAELRRAGSGGRARTFNLPIQSRPRRQLRHPRNLISDLVPPAGFEPASTGLKDRGPVPLDEGGVVCLERAAGIEPATDGLEDRGSATEYPPSGPLCGELLGSRATIVRCYQLPDLLVELHGRHRP